MRSDVSQPCTVMLNFLKAYDLQKATFPWFDGFEPPASKASNALIYYALYLSVKYFSDTIAKPQ
jgi:hypothetical protein